MTVDMRPLVGQRTHAQELEVAIGILGTDESPIRDRDIADAVAGLLSAHLAVADRTHCVPAPEAVRAARAVAVHATKARMLRQGTRP